MSRIHPSLPLMAPGAMAILPYASMFQHRSTRSMIFSVTSPAMLWLYSW